MPLVVLIVHVQNVCLMIITSAPRSCFASILLTVLFNFGLQGR